MAITRPLCVVQTSNYDFWKFGISPIIRLSVYIYIGGENFLCVYYPFHGPAGKKALNIFF